jgi:glycosyltransferase involved in cell wall biosynthesis
MPKVLRIINRFNIGGPTFNVAYLTKYLGEPYETLLIGGDKEAGEGSSLHILDELELKPIMIQNLQRKVAFISDIKAFFEIRKIIKTYQPDIVHTHASKAGALGRLAAITCKVPYIIHTFHGHVFHSYFGAFKTGIFKWIERVLAKKTDVIIAISHIQKEEIALQHRIAPLEKFRVVPLGFDLQRFQDRQMEKRASFRARYGLKTDDIAIGILGRLTEIKDHAFFIQLAARIPDGNVKFFIVGDGHLQASLIAYSESKGLQTVYKPEDGVSTKMIFTSWITNTDWFFAGIDILALTSKNEGTPVSLIEAQAAGKPVITTNVGGVENVLPANYPYCYPVGQFDAYLNGLKALITLHKNNSATKLIDITAIFKQFSYQRLVVDIKQVYDNLLQSKPKSD